MTALHQLPFNGYEISQAIASTWEGRRAQIEEVAGPVREWMIRELAPRPGDTVLEVAAGVGDTGFEAARLVGPGGRLISTDFSPAMLDAARRRGDELGVGNVDYRVMDAERIELDRNSVDGALCRYGYMLMAHPAAALAETRRVLRPGGRLALAVWGAPERNPFFTLVATSLVRHGHVPPPDPEGPGIFGMAGEQRTIALLRQAGFGEIRTEEVPVRFTVSGVDDYVGFVADTAGPIAVAFRALNHEERSRIRSDVEQGLVPFATEGGYELPGVTLAAVAG